MLQVLHLQHSSQLMMSDACEWSVSAVGDDAGRSGPLSCEEESDPELPFTSLIIYMLL